MTASSEVLVSDRSTVAAAGEHALIARIRERLPAPPEWLLVPPGDDAAVVAPVRNEFEVVTTDASIEGIHFDRRFVPSRAIGRRALAVNLSDLAAMGAEPRYALLSLALPPSLPLDDFDSIVDGLLEEAARHRVVLAGGNVSASPGPLIVDVTAAGSVRPRRLLRRSGAKPGDFVFVSGSIGGARAALELLKTAEDVTGTDSATLADRYLRPEARVRLGLLLGRNRAATACVDLSDGLADGLRQLAAASNVGITIDAEALPIDPAARQWFERRGEDPIQSALAGGDDYELLFTASPKRMGRLRNVERLARGLPLTRIGIVTKEGKVTVRRGTEEREIRGGVEHFV
ncbi:MAG TPA: thiamine-phosphate kinase [Vicinamibacterales bacterium]|nr:thiamine-phosphate kinase [Vicinamibacterales bacterium]